MILCLKTLMVVYVHAGNEVCNLEDGNHEYVKHQWLLFENGDEPVDGSCGSPIMDSNGNVVGLFRYKMANSRDCLGLQLFESMGMRSVVGSRHFRPEVLAMYIKQELGLRFISTSQ